VNKHLIVNKDLSALLLMLLLHQVGIDANEGIELVRPDAGLVSLMRQLHAHQLIKLLGLLVVYGNEEFLLLGILLV
jgi:hypothetical protein